MKAIAVAAALGLALLQAGCAPRLEPGYVWELRGTVVDFSATELTVRHKSGHVIRVQLDAATAFSQRRRPAGPEALARKARVAVDVEVLAGGGQRARAVRIAWGGRTGLAEERDREHDAAGETEQQ